MKDILVFCFICFSAIGFAELSGYSRDAGLFGAIMAGGTFVQGSSIELSVDGPMREPYIVYMQGGLSVSHVIAGVVAAVGQMEKGLQK